MRHTWLVAGRTGHRCFPSSSHATSSSSYSRHSASIGELRYRSFGLRSTWAPSCPSHSPALSILRGSACPGLFRDSRSLHLVRWLIAPSAGQEALTGLVSYRLGRCSSWAPSSSPWPSTFPRHWALLLFSSLLLLRGQLFPCWEPLSSMWRRKRIADSSRVLSWGSLRCQVLLLPW